MTVPPARRFPDVEPRPNRVIAIAGSAGGVQALRTVTAELPADLPAAVCVVLHIPADRPSRLASILDRHGGLPAVLAEDGAELRAGTIYVAPADHHLLVREHALELSRAAKEHGSRPAADQLFR
jgi:two-component system chemotaxis response regulator CheB